MNQPPVPEFSRLIAAHSLDLDGISFEIKAEKEERDRLAARFGLQSIARLEARLRLFAKGELIHLEGHLSADVVQTCVVTLEPVPQKIDVDFSRCYGEEEVVVRLLSLQDEDPESADFHEEDPDPIQGGMIDVGESTAEELALQLDPFPRKPGASLEGSTYAAKSEGEGEKPHPFAGLSKLKDKLDKKV